MFHEALAEDTMAARRRANHVPYVQQPRHNGHKRLVPGIAFNTAQYCSVNKVANKTEISESSINPEPGSHPARHIATSRIIKVS